MTGLQSEFDDDHDNEGAAVEITDNEVFYEVDIPDLSEQFNDETENVAELGNIRPQLPISLDYQMPSTSSHNIFNGRNETLSEHNYTSLDISAREAKTCKDWAKYTPDMLRQEISSPLKSTSKKLSSTNKENDSFKKNRNPLNSKLIEWSSSKIELSEIQKAAFTQIKGS